MENTATHPQRNGYLLPTPGFDAIWRERRAAFMAGDPEHALSIIHALLADALQVRASDIHFDPMSDGFQVRFRVDGVLHLAFTLDPDEGMRMVRFFKTAAELDPGSLLMPHDARARFEIDGREVELRLGFAPSVMGEKLALRLLLRDRISLNLGELGLTDQQKDFIDHWLHSASGLFLDAGPVGSGKTTTLYALISELDLARRNVVTIEDPVEYQVDGLTQMQVDERFGLEMGTGLRTILRLDPDYILIGEVRDEASARTVIDAAATGRVVLSTLHARDAAGTVTSLRNLGVADHEIAVALSFVTSQRLVRKLCATCRKQGKVEDVDRRWLDRMQLESPETAWTAEGCPQCQGDGYLGRSGVFELWPLDSKSNDLILAGADEFTIRGHIRHHTQNDLLKAGIQKVEDGLTTFSELRGMSGLIRPG